MDPASIILSEGLDPTKPKTYAALSEGGNVPRTTLWYRAHGRPSIEEKAKSQQYLTPQEEKTLVEYLKRMYKIGSPIPVKSLCSLAFVIARQRPSIFQAPATDETIRPPGKNWPQAFYKRHPEFKSKRVKALDWNRHDNNIYDKITHWFEVIGEQLNDPIILPEKVYNIDETGVLLSMLTSLKVLVGKDDARAYRGAGVKRTMVTAIECVSVDGRCLHPMIIWPAATHRSNWTTYPTPGWHYACSESGYTDSKISYKWLKREFDPQTKARANKKPRILICDGFGTHESLEVLKYCFENNIILCRIRSHTSHKLQPCDVGVFGLLKAAYRDEVERLYRGGANTVGKQHFTSLYSPAREKALTPRNIKAGWSATGLHPFNPDRVLRTIQKPSAKQVPPKNRVKIEYHQQSEILQMLNFHMVM
jgi:DDE superfamily endonuclease